MYSRILSAAEVSVDIKIYYTLTILNIFYFNIHTIFSSQQHSRTYGTRLMLILLGLKHVVEN
jgi:hypothetical protein